MYIYRTIVQSPSEWRPEVTRLSSWIVFLFGLYRGILSRTKKPVALIIDAIGIHIYSAKGREHHLNWGDISTLISRSYGLTLKTSSPASKSQPVNLITRGLDVSTWDIVTT